MQKNGLNVTESEWLILDELWKISPHSLMELVRIMQVKTGWAKSTTNTLIQRLEEKGLVGHIVENGKRQYYPLFEHSELAAEQTEKYIDRVFDGRISKLVSCMVMQKGISKTEIEEIKRVLLRYEESDI